MIHKRKKNFKFIYKRVKISNNGIPFSPGDKTTQTYIQTISKGRAFCDLYFIQTMFNIQS